MHFVFVNSILGEYDNRKETYVNLLFSIFSSYGELWNMEWYAIIDNVIIDCLWNDWI